MSRNPALSFLAGALLIGACGSPRATAPPDAKLLCGTWEGEGTRERWWIEGRDLRGEGHTQTDQGELELSERLVLRHGKRGHVYIAQPGEAAPTSFSPIDPSAARYPVQVPAATLVWVWANYEHDFPQEIHYGLQGDQLEATVAGPGAGMGWKLARIRPCDS
ncbi:hypothetical protein DB30_04643 [Enhygromyxa salina]|uniref:Lipoprotein n=1 Tax=Enhygromyxa salina TaxID=215803 RepID=A0A0C2A708_9BACT|nr:hypothetical protein [Enhygromyxa salina]KIG19178.1 hypothetical protein DB30_04643 [Enhygromyxa salina]